MTQRRRHGKANEKVDQSHSQTQHVIDPYYYDYNTSAAPAAEKLLVCLREINCTCLVDVNEVADDEQPPASRLLRSALQQSLYRRGV